MAGFFFAAALANFTHFNTLGKDRETIVRKQERRAYHIKTEMCYTNNSAQENMIVYPEYDMCGRRPES